MLGWLASWPVRVSSVVQKSPWKSHVERKLRLHRNKVPSRQSVWQESAEQGAGVAGTLQGQDKGWGGQPIETQSTSCIRRDFFA